VTLAAGDRLGTYEILTSLGAGGMGEVYRAHDGRLGREVAVKVLPDVFASDPDRAARFDREARALATLNHPGIAAIYGLEEQSGLKFLVMELVPGETLEERLRHGPLPVDEALPIAAAIAAALEAAHEKGIVHRDLKPANVKVTPEGGVKVLDFGLAKATPDAAHELSVSPTLTAAATRAGAVLGTPVYMSPEQSRGKPVDKRADLWSFGCLLYEMLTGARPFEGETTSDVIAAVLTREPDWSALPAGTPDTVRRLLRRCLEKDPAHRLRDAGDARLEFEEALAPRRAPEVRRRVTRTVWQLLALVLVLVLVTFALPPVRRVRPAARPPTLTQITSSEGVEQFPAWSPGDDRLVYAAEVGPVRKLFVRRLDTGEETQLTHGDQDDIQPAWSPDGTTVVFVRGRQPGKRLEPGDVFGMYESGGGDLWAVDVGTGRESQRLSDGFDPAFSRDGTRIAVDASWGGPRRLWVLDAQGRNPQQATTDVSEAVVHIRPRWSPDGTKLVFQNLERTKFDVRVVDVATKKMAWITNDVTQDLDPVWSPDGRFIYFSSYRGGGINIWRAPVAADGSSAGLLEQLTTGAGQDVQPALSSGGRRIAFTILKQNADLWKLPVSPTDGRPAGPPQAVIATTREDSRGSWSPDGRTIAFNSDRTGEMNIWIAAADGTAARQLTRGPGGDFQPSWSPDGQHIVFFSSRAGSADIWDVEVASGRLRQLTRDGTLDINPFFSPDGKRIAFQSDKGGRLEVWVMNADGSEPRPLTQVGVSGHFLRWTADGQAVVFRCPCGGQAQTLQAPLAGGDPQPLAKVAGGAHMSFSPDFSSVLDAVGHKALWVSPLRGGEPVKVFEFEDADVRIDYPVWSPDGRLVLMDRFRPQGGDVWMMDQ
jgi:Tol biopolymer transport system component